ncbi:peflin, putative [Entamoeba invadens IP1]|uniref:Peflin, putative n=2 Tax=Entamoeba invadens TaxID=33085 RepID=A0A0A1U421_ENTIV|nr:peflin, putative [Entamoeba invadens IP1]ELP87448.1 peflin, putative [Entamoeba invadens IP1]BAN41992.1 peflin, putative [Entamoeba invadens]|eukprot:XP_004254219.1 peflin, putative [Entamoeba invadens IP1]
MSLFQIQAAADAWLAQNITAAYAADPRVKNEWWYPLASSVAATEFRGYQDWFQKVDKDKSGTLELNELKKATFPGKIKLDDDTCKHLMSIFDIDRSNSIGFYEYLALMKYVELTTAIFKQFDKDKSNSLDEQEIFRAMPQLGFDLNMNSCRILLKTCGKGLLSKKVNVSQFIGCAAYLGQIRTIYQHGFKQAQGPFQRATFAKFMNLTLNLMDDA